MTITRAISLILANAFVATSALASPLGNLKMDGALLSSPDSREFVAALQPSVWPFDDVRPLSAQTMFDDYWKKVGGADNVEWEVYSSKKPSVFLSFPLSSAYFEKTQSWPVLLATIKNTEGLVQGFFAVTFLRSFDGQREAVIEYIMSPEGNGLAAKIFNFIREDLTERLGLKKVYAELEWAGREYWADPRFGFRLSPIQPQVIYDREQLSFIEIIRGNFKRFLIRHGLSEGDLVFGSSNSSFELSNLESPSDLLEVRARNGKKVEVDALKSFGNSRRRRLNVGRAFLVADHGQQAQRGTLMIGGRPFSDSAMPPWFGVIQKSQGSCKSCSCAHLLM